MLVTELARRLVDTNLSLCTIESCTGGSIAALCTEQPGSSVWFRGGVVTYSNALKIRLGVAKELIDRFGPVSREVAVAMAEQGRLYCQADWSVAVTGVAGPAGGSAETPVGCVWLAWASDGKTWVERQQFSGHRGQIRLSAAQAVLGRLIELLDCSPSS